MIYKDNVMKKYILLLLLVNIAIIFAKEKDMPSKDVSFGELLKVEIIASYHIDNIQWFKDGVAIKGANQRQYIVKNARLGDEGIYYATMMGPCREMTSTPIFVRIILNDKPFVETISSGGNILLAAEPNPASDLVKFKFNLNSDNKVKLVLNDLLGNQVAVIYDGIANAGPNFIELNLSKYNLTNGTYFYTLISDNYTETRSLQVLK